MKSKFSDDNNVLYEELLLVLEEFELEELLSEEVEDPAEKAPSIIVDDDSN